MKETPLQLKLQEYLKTEYGAFCLKHNGNLFTNPGHPDLYGFIQSSHGVTPFFFEVKVAGSKHNKKRVMLQRLFLQRIRAAGCRHASFITSMADVDKVFQEGVFLDFS
jgi:hypothetical protein